MNDHRWRTWFERIRRSAMLYGAFGTAVRVGAHFLLVPLVLTCFSPREQAIWWIFVALGNFANLADFGFGPVVTRVYTFLWAGAKDFSAEGLPPPPGVREPNFVRLNELNAAVRFLYLRLSLLAMVLLGVGGTLLLLRPVRETGPLPYVWLTWVAYWVVVGYNLYASHWVLACQGINRVREAQAATFWSSLLYLVTGAVLLISGAQLFSMVAAVAVRGVVSRLLCRRAYRMAVGSAWNNPSPDINLVRRLWPNAWKFGVMSVGGYLVGNVNIFVCSYLLGVAATASYGLTAQIATFAVNLSSLWLTVKWPQITIFRTHDQKQEMSVLFARRLALVMASYVFLAVTVILLANPVLQWTGSQTLLLPAPCLILYLAYMGLQTFYVQFALLTFTENVVPFFKISIFTGLGLVALSLAFTPPFGLWGMLLAPLVAEWACSGWYIIRRGFQGQSLSVPQFWRGAVYGRL